MEIDSLSDENKKRKREKQSPDNKKTKLDSITKKQIISLLQESDKHQNKNSRILKLKSISSLANYLFKKDPDAFPSKKETCIMFCSELSLLNKSKLNRASMLKSIRNYIISVYEKSSTFKDKYDLLFETNWEHSNIYRVFLVHEDKTFSSIEMKIEKSTIQLYYYYQGIIEADEDDSSEDESTKKDSVKKIEYTFLKENIYSPLININRKDKAYPKKLKNDIEDALTVMLDKLNKSPVIKLANTYKKNKNYKPKNKTKASIDISEKEDVVNVYFTPTTRKDEDGNTLYTIPADNFILEDLSCFFNPLCLKKQKLTKQELEYKCINTSDYITQNDIGKRNYLLKNQVLIVPETSTSKIGHCYNRKNLLMALKSNKIWGPYPAKTHTYFKLPFPPLWLDDNSVDQIIKHKYLKLKKIKDEPIGSEFGISNLHGEVHPIYTLVKIRTK